MPEVSRIVVVPLGIHLDMQHLVIQAAMGWSNTHLWLIQARGSTWGLPDPDYPDDTVPASRTTLIDRVADTGTPSFDVIYDFGDQRCQTVRIVKPIGAARGVAYPLLIDAVGRCPLEDSGGPWGYRDMLEALCARSHPRHAEVMAWPGPEYDPAASDHGRLEQAVVDLAKLLTPRRRGSTKPRTASKRSKTKGRAHRSAPRAMGLSARSGKFRPVLPGSRRDFQGRPLRRQRATTGHRIGNKSAGGL